MSSTTSIPAMSVVMITPDTAATIRRTLMALRAQTARARLEIVIVAPSRESLRLNEADVDVFAGYQIVEAGPLESTSVARAAGIRAAVAPIVALTEDHCYPEPEWAEVLIQAHEGAWAGVGPAVMNGNPVSLITWGNMVTEYGPWLDPAPGGEHSHIPGHNSSYKRSLLLQYGDRLSEVLEAESTMQWDLGRQGHKFAIAPRARVKHINFARFRSSVPLRFYSGRLFAANRARGWSAGRRAVYAVAAPLIPALRTARAIQDLRRIGRGPLLPRLVPVVAALCVVDALGEFVGYVAGAGDAMRRLTDQEFRRERYSGRTRRMDGLPG